MLVGKEEMVEAMAVAVDCNQNTHTHTHIYIYIDKEAMKRTTMMHCHPPFPISKLFTLVEVAAMVALGMIQCT